MIPPVMWSLMRFGRRLLTGRVAVVAVLTVLVSTNLVRADGAVTAPGSLSGVVSTHGTGLPGVAVSAVPTAGGSAAQVVSGEHGVFRIASLAPGSYDLVAELEGFRPATIAGVTLSAGESRRVDIELDVAVFGDNVAVIGQMPQEALAAAEIRESGARDAGEAMTRLGGVWKVRKGGIANDIVLGGYQGPNLNVLVDGARAHGACPNGMDPAAFHVDFAEIDRIEVAKGPFDVKSSGSLGGVVNIVTRKPEEGWHASANLAGGSYSFVNPSAVVSYGGPRLSGQAGYSYRSSQPYEDGSGRAFTELANYRPDAVDSDAFEVGTAWGRLVLAPAEGHSVQLAYTRQEADHVLYPYLMMDAIFDDTDRANVSYEFTGNGTVLRAVRAQAYLTRVEHWMTDAFRTSSTTAPREYAMGSDASSEVTGGEVEVEAGPFTAGIEVVRQEWSTTTMLAGMGYQPQYSLPGVVSDTLGAYVEYLRPLSESVVLQAGARWDETDSQADPDLANTNLYYAYKSTREVGNVASEPSGNLRLIVTPAAGLELSVGAGHSVRYPDARELFFSLRRMGSDWVGNPALKPARNTGLSVNASYRKGSFYLSGRVFHDRVDDYITVHNQQKVNMVPGVMNSVARSYENVDAQLTGGDLAASWAVGGRLFFSADLGAVVGRKDPRPEVGITTTTLAEMPPTTLRVAGRYDTGKLFAELEGVFADAQDRVDADLGETTTPGYGVANLRVGATWRGLRVVLGLLNALDRQYSEALSYQRDPFRSGVRVSEPGRNFTLNLAFAI